MTDTAMYHFNINYISRKQGKFVINKTAYITGKKIQDKYYGMTYDYTDRSDILHTEVLLPQYAPTHFRDMEMLVNAMEEAEKRFDSRTAREIVLSLFNNKGIEKEQEFTLAERIELVRCFANKAFVSHGMCAIVAIHKGVSKDDSTKNNPHVHILLTDRPVYSEGFCKKNRDWNKKENVINWRKLWADAQNNEFKRKNLQIRVSEKSHIMLGIDREPTKHKGQAVIALEKRGEETDRSVEYKSIQARNKAREKQKHLQYEHKQNRERERSF